MRLSMLAQLEGISLTDAIRQAIEGYVEQQRSETDLTARAGQALEEIERDASARREAIKSWWRGGTATKAAGRSRKGLRRADDVASRRLRRASGRAHDLSTPPTPTTLGEPTKTGLGKWSDFSVYGRGWPSTVRGIK